MTIRRPNLEGPGKVSPQGAFAHEIVNFLRQLADSANASTSALAATTTETSPIGLQAQIDAIEAGIAAMYGTGGVTVVGSLASGLVIQGSGGGSAAARVAYGA